MTLMTAMKAMEIGIDKQSFREWAETFKEAFKPNGESITDLPTDYERFTGSGSTDRAKAIGRKEEMIRHLESFGALYND